MEKNIIVGRFDKKENFGFLVPDDKKEYKSDFFVTLRNSMNANNGDIVEAYEVINKKGKSKEAKIKKILEEFKQKKIITGAGKNNIVGIYSQGKGDFGFVDVEGIDKGYFVFGDNKNGALDGDKVEASVKIFKGKEEAEIEKVLERKLDLIVGEFKDSGKFGFVIPKNQFIKNHIFVPGTKFNNAKDGDIVGVHVTKWIGKNPEGTIKEIIGKIGDKYIDLESIIVEGGARLKFPQKVLDYVNKIKNPFTPSPIRRGLGGGIKRKDLTKLFTFTIDSEDAKDLDDAISIEKIPPLNLPLAGETSKNSPPAREGLGEGYKLYVHIADVSHYVTEKSELDVEAYKRATSIYLTDRVIPMLPEKLSNDLCSLNPSTNKFTLTCEMIFNSSGHIIDINVYESIINSDFRLTYKDVDEILSSFSIQKNVASFSGEGERIQDRGFNIGDNIFFGQKLTHDLTDKILISSELKNKISKYKQSNGVLNFDFPETKIILNDEKQIIDIKEYPRYESNKIIEEFMISANESVSKYFSKFPFLYRIHEEPKEENLLSLQEKLNLFEVNFKFEKGDTKEFSKLLDLISSLDETKKSFIEKMILRTLSKAVYSKENFGHFGLGLSFYSHFTSPIRRYPDLQIHRIIKEKLNKKLNPKRLHHFENILDKVANYTSEKERKAEKLEYKVKDYFIVNYYLDKIGECFEGVITGVIPKGFFVGLEDTAEGFVEMISSDFREELQEHIDLKTGNKYRLGEKVKVKLIEADKNLLRLNFKII